MPDMSARAPGLYKPKSKMRLKFGLTASPQAPSIRSRSEEPPIQQFSSTSTASSLQFSYASTNDPLESLGASTNTTSTGTSRWARGDSRDAFALDISPSESDRYPNPAFDTISYATASPQSLAFDTYLDSRSTLALQENDVTDAPCDPVDENDTVEELRYRFGEANLNDTHPEITVAISKYKDVLYMSPYDLLERFSFYAEEGYGNWGSVWRARPRRFVNSEGETAMGIKLGVKSAMLSGSEACGFIAVKVVQRGREDGEPMTLKQCRIVGERVTALWREMKVVRTLRHEPHPSIINFEAFIVTIDWVMILMPYHSHLIEINLAPERAVLYMRQIASAIGYLHERGITHNDIKPTNIMISFSDVPVLVDFGFASKYDVGSQGCFLSTERWGTPEYMDPFRTRGLPHDERASDVWSLGITFFELLVGRTMFELEGEPPLEDNQELLIMYYERTVRGTWLGEWYIPRDLEHLIRAMVCPDPAYRITATQAYHHPALHPKSPEVIVTPHFVREARLIAEDHVAELPLPTSSTRHWEDVQFVDKKKVKKNKKKAGRRPPRATTPALGESIKQHTNVPFMHGADQPVSKPEKSPSPRKARPNKTNVHLVAKPKGDMEEITPTKRGKVENLRVKELSAAETRIPPRVSGGQVSTLSRAASADSLSTSNRVADNPDSAISTTSTIPAKTKAEAVLRTMRSLEGTRRVERVKSRDVLAAIKRPAPSPPRPRSLDSQVEAESRKTKEEQRRSLGVERKLADLTEESPPKANAVIAMSPPKQTQAESPARKSPAGTVRVPSMASPPRPRNNTRPTEVIRAGGLLSADEKSSPITELRHRILTIDKDNLERFRKVSGDLMASRSSVAFAQARGEETTTGDDAVRTERLDKFASWMRDVEQMVEDARKALAEGREPALPSLALPEGLTVPNVSVIPPTSNESEFQVVTGEKEETEVDEAHQKRFGLTPPKTSVPVHLRTSSTQVEPATPPKWMTEQQAEERARLAMQVEEEKLQGETKSAPLENKQLKEKKSGSFGKIDLAVVKKGPKKERPNVTHVFKMFGNEKDKPAVRSFTPEPMSTVPLKPAAPALRVVPSTPALRSSTVRHSKQLGRKSESNLRNFNTMPTLATLMAESEQAERDPNSPRRAVYEDLLESEPGVSRQGEGWSSRMGNNTIKPVSKTTSMASLREKALSFLRDDHRESRDLRQLQADIQNSKRESKDINATGRERHIVDLSKEDRDQDDRKRPGTPGANSLLRSQPGAEKRGIFGRLKGLVGRKGERADESG